MSEAQVDVAPVEIEVPVEVKNIIEALIFACDEPMTVRMIRGIIEEANKERLPHEQFVVNADVIRKAVADLNRGYGRLGSGFRIVEIAGGFVYATQEQFAAWVGKLAKEKARRRLSPTAVETLAIIAYKQPITKVEVEFIRGVNVDYIINALLEKDLIHITGRQNSPGRPLLYGTTQKFLEHFGLNEITDLPKPREIAELINETEAEVDRRLLAEQQELEFKESLENKLEGHEGAAKKERTPKQPKVKVPEEIKSERTKTSDGEDRKSEVRDRISEAENQKTEVELTRNDVGSVIENIEEVEESKSDEVSLDGEIGETTIEQQSAISIAAEERIEENGEANVEPVVDVPHETLNIEQGTSNIESVANDETPQPVKVFGEEGAELSTHRGSITEETEHPQHAADRQAGDESGWSKWKSKVKTFFKKLFG
ncbi:MAG: SMC-Scp complex subunit ScpB [Bacteroidota bacterium]